MSFLSAMFLWALPLVAVPVIVHLFHRREQQVVPWGAMQFLLEAASRRRSMWRLDDLILMLLRALALLVIVLAIARPLVTSNWLGSPAGRDVVLVIDNSMSAARLADGRPVFDRVAERAQELVRGLSDADTVRVMLAANGPQVLTPAALAADSGTRAQLVERIAALRPTLGSADWQACIERALAGDADDRAVARFIVVLADGSAEGWKSDSAGWQNVRRALEGSKVPVTVNVVEFSDDKPQLDNLSVDALITNRPLVGLNEPFALSAHVRNFGKASSGSHSLAWEVDGESIGLSSVPELEPGQAVDIPFEHALERAGAFAITANLRHEDPLDMDNSATTVLEAAGRVPILVVTHKSNLDPLRGDAGYFLAALGSTALAPPESADGSDGDGNPVPGTGAWRSAFVPTAVEFDDLPASDLSAYRCIVLANLPPLEPATVEKLRQFVEGGGGLWIALGRRTEPPAFNERVYADGAGLSPLRIVEAVGDENNDNEFIAVHPPDGDHPAVKLLGDTVRLDVDEVRILRRFRFEPAPENRRASVLLETGSGEALAAESFHGRGRIIVQAIPFDAAWSNLPACDVFVAMVHEWLWYLAEPSVARRNLRSGEPIIAELPADAQLDPNTPPQASVLTPGGDKIALSPAPGLAAASARPPHFQFSGTRPPGTYLVSVEVGDESQLRMPFQVAREPSESNLAPLDEAQRAALIAAAGLHFVAQPLAHTLSRPVKTYREPMWNYLIVAALILMAAEIAFAGWLARRKFQTSA